MTMIDSADSTTDARGELPDFRLTGVEAVVFAVEDRVEAARFAADWGLAEDGGTPGSYRTLDGCRVNFVDSDPLDPTRTPVGDSSGLVGFTMGTRDAEVLPLIAAELGRDREVVVEPDGTVTSHDDLGFRISFRPTSRALPEYEATTYNSPGHFGRIDQRAVKYDRAEPREISHLAISVDNAVEASQFYLDRLGFIVTDRYADRGLFLRCAPAGNHHNLFFMNGARPGTRFNHLSFKVRDVHETIFGGQAFEAKGWTTFAGPGRHEVSSACFWYFLTPFGGSFEYAADEDMVTEKWEPKDFAATGYTFSQWTFGLEKGDGSLRGPISASKAVTGSTSR